MNATLESRKNQIVYLAPILIIALLLRLILIGHKCFWADEGITWYMALGEIHRDSPPIYFYLFNWSIQLFGWNEFAGRLPSAIFGWLSIPIIYVIGKSFFSRKFGLYLASIAALSPYLITLSQEMRIYSLLGFEILLALWFFLNILKNEQKNSAWWIGLLITGIIGQYTHCFFIFILGFFGLVLLAKVGWREWRRWIKFLLMTLTIILLSLPQLLQTFFIAGERQHIYASDSPHLLTNAYRVFRSYFSFVFGEFLTNLPGSIGPFLQTHVFHFAVAIVMIVVWLFIVILGMKELLKILNQNDFRALTIKVISGMLIIFTLFFFIIDISTSGHVIFIYVPFLFLVTSFFTFNKTRIRNIILVFFLALNIIALFDYYKSPCFAYERSDWQAAGNLLKREYTPGDAVLILGARNAYYTLKFYYPELDENVYYRPRHDPDFKTDRYRWEWWREKSTNEKIYSLMSVHPRLWLVKFDQPWDADESIREVYRGNSWNLGQELQVHLFEDRLIDLNQ